MLGILFDDVSCVNRLMLSIKGQQGYSSIRDSGVEVGAYHDGFCESLATDIAEA